MNTDLTSMPRDKDVPFVVIYVPDAAGYPSCDIWCWYEPFDPEDGDPGWSVFMSNGDCDWQDPDMPLCNIQGWIELPN